MLHQVAKRKVALAVTGALVASGLLASSALAAPTGSITIGPRISTGQLTAQFYSTSDQYDPTYGYGLSWFPNATLAAPGEQARRPRQPALAGGRLRCGREAAEPILELRDVRHPGAPWARLVTALATDTAPRTAKPPYWTRVSEYRHGDSNPGFRRERAAS